MRPGIVEGGRPGGAVFTDPPDAVVRGRVTEKRNRDRRADESDVDRKSLQRKTRPRRQDRIDRIARTARPAAGGSSRRGSAGGRAAAACSSARRRSQRTKRKDGGTETARRADQRGRVDPRSAEGLECAGVVERGLVGRRRAVGGRRGRESNGRCAGGSCGERVAGRRERGGGSGGRSRDAEQSRERRRRGSG